MEILQSAEKFIYRNARPLELSLWKYHFENGNKDDVVKTLMSYQNEDGGFGHALEPDSLNPHSSPITTNYAVQILDEIDFCDDRHPIIFGILRYLSSGKDFINGKWCNVIPSNNDYPHAIWWNCDNSVGIPSDNPTVSLAGFVLKFSDRNSELFSKCLSIANHCVENFLNENCNEMHTLRCYINLLNFINGLVIEGLFDVEQLKNKLFLTANDVLCKDPKKWETEYVCKPSNFFDRHNIIFDTIDDGLKKAECTLIENTQLHDGSFNITWLWHNDYKEFEVSRIFWKSIVTLNNMVYYSNVNK